MGKVNIQEKAYVELIDFLGVKLEENEKKDFNGRYNYEFGFCDGESELIKELLMKMQKEVIGWHD